jgi:hypothetical protein
LHYIFVSVLRAAKVAEGAGREVTGVRRWALEVQSRTNHNKAACNDWHFSDADSMSARDVFSPTLDAGPLTTKVRNGPNSQFGVELGGQCAEVCGPMFCVCCPAYVTPPATVVKAAALSLSP